MRFLAVVAIGWVGMRVAWLWPEGMPPDRWVRIMLPTGQGTAVVPPPPVVRASSVPEPLRGRPRRPVARTVVARAPMPITAMPLGESPTPADADRVRLALVGLVGFASAEPVQPTAAPMLSPPLPPASDRRISVSLWALARPGAATGGPVQLGGGQAGMRVRIPVTANGRAAVAARVAAPLAGPGREVALGVEWRPLPVPVALVVERRVALDTSRSGTGVGVIAGVDRQLAGGLAGGLAVEAYGQAGAVARDGIEPYADGAARLLHPVAAAGRATLRLGVGGWGTAQREGARIDVGPSAVAAVPVGRGAVRLSFDWRQRIGGTAAPGSGPALTIGSDF